MQVNEWMDEYFKYPHSKQLYDKWVMGGKDIDKLWLYLESDFMYSLLVRLPKSFMTREKVLAICEEIIEHFGLQKVKTEYWWVESGIMGNNGKNVSLSLLDGWQRYIGSLQYDTGVRNRGVYHKSHPELWNIVWKHIPQISTVIETYGE